MFKRLTSFILAVVLFIPVFFAMPANASGEPPPLAVSLVPAADAPEALYAGDLLRLELRVINPNDWVVPTFNTRFEFDPEYFEWVIDDPGAQLHYAAAAPPENPNAPTRPFAVGYNGGNTPLWQPPPVGGLIEFEPQFTRIGEDFGFVSFTSGGIGIYGENSHLVTLHLRLKRDISGIDRTFIRTLPAVWGRSSDETSWGLLTQGVGYSVHFPYIADGQLYFSALESVGRIILPSFATFGTPLTLSGAVLPGNATNRTITGWRIIDPGTAGAVLSGNTVTFASHGTATLEATIANGISAGVDFIQPFDIEVNARATIANLTLADNAPANSHVIRTGDSRWLIIIPHSLQYGALTNDMLNFTTEPPIAVQGLEISGGHIVRTIRIRADTAQNPRRWLEMQEPVIVSTVRTPPNRVAGLRAEVNHKQARLNWSVPFGPTGVPIIRYEIQWKETESPDWNPPIDAGSSPSYLMRQLANGVSYDFQVRAVNLSGPGDWSATASATPWPNVNIDIDGDGETNAADATILRRFLSLYPTPEQRAEILLTKPVLDTNFDEVFNEDDLTHLRRIIAGHYR